MKIKSKGEKLDFTATAVGVVSRAIGENLFDGTPLLEEPRRQMRCTRSTLTGHPASRTLAVIRR
jgi:hypothetical protein